MKAKQLFIILGCICLLIIGFTFLIRESNNRSVLKEGDNLDYKIENSLNVSPSGVYVVEPTYTSTTSLNKSIDLYYNNQSIEADYRVNVDIPVNAILEPSSEEKPIGAYVTNGDTKLYFGVSHVAVDTAYEDYTEVASGTYRVTTVFGDVFYTKDVELQNKCRDVPGSVVLPPCGLPIISPLAIKCIGVDFEFCDAVFSSMNVDELD